MKSNASTASQRVYDDVFDSASPEQIRGALVADVMAGFAAVMAQPAALGEEWWATTESYERNSKPVSQLQAAPAR